MKGKGMNKRIRVLIADDQSRARQSMKALLTTAPQIAEVREAVNGRDAVRLIEEAQPDLVLMDVRMPEMEGLETTRYIKRHWPWIKIVILSMYPEYSLAALAAGADAFVSKGETPTKLLRTLEEIISRNKGQASMG
jgi:DNA-binding NarL/FixJ family response regulator